MSLKLFMAVRVIPETHKRLTFNDVNLNTKMLDLKVEIAKQTNLPMEALELAYCGNILGDDQTVQECGLKHRNTVHVLRKNIWADYVRLADAITDVQIKAISQAFRTISLDPAFRNALQMMKQPSNIENLLMVTPQLLHDPAAIAIIQDPELVVRMADYATAKKMAVMHPALVETANHIAGAVQAESARTNPTNSSYNDSSYSYAMDEFSDEEEMDSSQSSDSVAGNSRGSRGQITAPQLAAALASATGAFQSLSGTSSTPRASTSSGQGGSSPAVITSEMLQSAFANITPPATAGSFPFLAPRPPGTPPTISTGSTGTPMAQQIQQMHDLGLLDDVVNMHALAITGGDVQAAINLVLSGVISHEDDF